MCVSMIYDDKIDDCNIVRHVVSVHIIAETLLNTSIHKIKQ